ncbi:MAG TPA: carbohydrate binding domain-containing protein [Polyangia bacterium]|nr:carbohydrate binding domain-containing protein [Polyangia bacterium]
MGLKLKIGAAALLLPACVIPGPKAATPAPAPAASAAAPTPAAPPPSTTSAPAADAAHDPGRWFPFPARGASAPTGLVDLSALNDTPAGARGFIRAAGGHFVDGTGARARFFGVDCTATACFPTHEVATRAAAHLRRLGVNAVRLHFMDKGAAPVGLLVPRHDQSEDQLDPRQLDRLDFFVAELAKNGIYVDVNLHVARRYPELEGPAAQRFEFGKMLDRFYPPFIASQKAYARALLTHVNPYTGRAYAAEPAVLCVEMNNENTALPFWAGTLDELPEPYAGELRRQWNVWLRARHGTTTRLRAAWGGAAPAAPKEILTNADLSAGTTGWTFESAGVPTRGEVVPLEGGGRALRFSADRRGTASWHLQFYRAHLPLTEGESYHLGFRVRAVQGGAAPPARTLEVSAMLAVADWRNIGMSRTLALSPAWQRVDLTFRPQGSIPGEGRITFSLRNLPGAVELADVSLTAGSPPVALAAGETVEAGTIPLVRGETGSPAGEDVLRFLADTDRATAHALATYIRHELGLKSMLVDTQASYGGLEGLRRELADSDFVDMHAYWQHPDFAAGWSKLRFHIDNTTQAGARDGGALGSLAVYRVAGKPFTVSEYNVPAPNDYAGEALPMYAAIAAAQDWDAIYAYTYLDFASLWDADHLLGFFDLAGNPAALSFLPVAALTFRQGLVAPLPAVARLALPAPRNGDPPLVGEGALAKLWTAAGLPPGLLALRRLEIAPNEKRSSAPGAADRPGQIRWDATARAQTFTVEAPALRIAAGKIAGTAIDLGGVQLQVGELPRGDATVALVALDGAPLDASKRMLLVAVARVENTAMTWNDTRTGLTSWGRGPALAEYVPIAVTLPWPDARAERLDPAGASVASVPVETAAGRSTLRLDHQPSLWFLIRR